MSEQVSTYWAYILFDVSIKACILWWLCEFVSHSFKQLSVHARHRIWSMNLLALIFLPLLFVVGPLWSLPRELIPWDEMVSQGSSHDADTPTELPSRSEIPAEQFLNSDSILPESASRFLFLSPDAIESNAIEMQQTGDNQKSKAREQSLHRPAALAAQTQDLHSTSISVANLWSLQHVTTAIPAIWLCGAVIMLLRLLATLVYTNQILYRSTLVRNTAFSSEISVCESSQIRSPVIVGWWRPCVLLPVGWGSWSIEKQKAVLAHEVSHLRRKDGLLNFIAEIVTVGYWFHPAAWLTKRNMQRLAEFACDEAAALETGDRLSYARELVEIASLNSERAVFLGGTAMARQSEIGQRVKALLDFSKPIASRLSWTASITILMVGLPIVLAIALLGIASAQSNRKTEEAAASSIRDDGQMILRGRVEMPDGSAASGVLIEVIDEKFEPKLVGKTDRDGTFEINLGRDSRHVISVVFRTVDCMYERSLHIFGYDLHHECKMLQRVRLETTKVIELNVSENQIPVENAHVQIEFDFGRRIQAFKTNAEGRATIRVRDDSHSISVIAWTDDHRIGGEIVQRNPATDEMPIKFDIDISRGDPIRVRCIDSDGKPIENLTLAFDGGFFRENPTSVQVTDEKGEALFSWVPNWETEFRVQPILGNEAPDFDVEPLSDAVDGVYTLKVERPDERTTIKGKITGDLPNKAGFYVELWGLPSEDAERFDVVYARSDTDGELSAEVLPGVSYSVYVQDAEFVSVPWKGMIVDEDKSIVRVPELSLIPGTPIEVEVTGGFNREAIKNISVSLSSIQQGTYVDSHGRDATFRVQAETWKKTDENGRIVAKVAAGELKIRIDDGDWNLQRNLTVLEGQPNKFSLHREVVEKQAVRGKLVFPDGVLPELGGTSIRIAGMDGETKDSLTVSCDSQGNFAAEIVASRISILAATQDESYFGQAIVNVEGQQIEVPMFPTFTYQARVIDENLNPVVGLKIEMHARLTDREGHYPANTSQYDLRFVDYYEHKPFAVTDADGFVDFPKTLPRIAISLFAPSPMDPNEGEHLGDSQKWFEPNQVRSTDILRVRSVGQAVRKPQKTLEQILTEMYHDARIAKTRVLIIVAGAGKEMGEFLDNNLYAAPRSQLPEASRYRVRKIEGPIASRFADRVATFERNGWLFPEPNTFFLVAFNENGVELGRLLLDYAQPESCLHQATAFVKLHAPPPCDANEDLAAALSEAKSSGRRLWASRNDFRFEQYNGWARWLDSHRNVLEKDYVLFTFDVRSQLNGVAVGNALQLEGHGILSHAIYDSDGKTLITSIGPTGNVANPIDSKNGANHLRKMLTSTAVKITPKEIESLYRSLFDNLVRDQLLLGEASLTKNDFKTATKHWEAALNIDPTQIAALHNLAVIKSRLRPPQIEEALALLDRALKVCEDAPEKLVVIEIWDSRGEVLQAAERYQEAIEAYKRVIEREPGRFTTRRRLAECFDRVGNTTEAESQRAEAESLGFGQK